MGAFLDKPRTEKYNESGSAAHGTLRYGLASMQGWRVEMEDSHVARTSLPDPLGEMAFFAVFDGHAGAKISKYASINLLDAILQTPEMRMIAGEVQALRKEIETEHQQQQQNIAADDAVARKPMPKVMLDSRQAQIIAGGLKSGFLAFDERMRTMPPLYSENERSGATAVSALVTPSHIFLANLGDSRSVISRGGRVCFATEDHKPYLPKERERIVNAGGSVMIQRVNGSLAVSRALGDYDYKSVPRLTACQQLVSPEPDVYVIERELSPPPSASSVAATGGATPALSIESSAQTPASELSMSAPVSPSPLGPGPTMSAPVTPAINADREPNFGNVPTSPTSVAPKAAATSPTPASPTSPVVASPIRSTLASSLGGEGGRDEFFILACDGIFDVITNQELCDFVRSRLQITNRLELICNQILDSCLSKGSKDNMTIILVTFPGAPQVSNDAVAREQQFEFHLRERIEEIVMLRDSANDTDVDYVLRALMNQEIPGLPPGAGLHAMRSLVEATLDDIKAKLKSSSTPATPVSPSAPVNVNSSASANKTFAATASAASPSKSPPKKTSI